MRRGVTSFSPSVVVVIITALCSSSCYSSRSSCFFGEVGVGCFEDVKGNEKQEGDGRTGKL